MPAPINMAIFASGSGTNADALYDYFKNHTHIKVALVVSNKADAYVLERARKWNIPTLVIDKQMFTESSFVIDHLKEKNIQWVILAGFLWKIPETLIQAFPQRIINIHPALLPKYGGKGMYGMNVHKAVIENKEKESGITIHYVNEHYDEGKVIAQYKCSIHPDDTPETLAEKIHQLEYKYFPETIGQVLKQLE